MPFWVAMSPTPLMISIDHALSSSWKTSSISRVRVCPALRRR